MECSSFHKDQEHLNRGQRNDSNKESILACRITEATKFWKAQKANKIYSKQNENAKQWMAHIIREYKSLVHMVHHFIRSREKKLKRNRWIVVLLNGMKWKVHKVLGKNALAIHSTELHYSIRYPNDVVPISCFCATINFLGTWLAYNIWTNKFCSILDVIKTLIWAFCTLLKTRLMMKLFDCK